MGSNKQTNPLKKRLKRRIWISHKILFQKIWESFTFKEIYWIIHRTFSEDFVNKNCQLKIMNNSIKHNSCSLVFNVKTAANMSCYNSFVLWNTWCYQRIFRRNIKSQRYIYKDKKCRGSPVLNFWLEALWSSWLLPSQPSGAGPCDLRNTSCVCICLCVRVIVISR